MVVIVESAAQLCQLTRNTAFDSCVGLLASCAIDGHVTRLTAEMKLRLQRLLAILLLSGICSVTKVVGKLDVQVRDPISVQRNV